MNLNSSFLLRRSLVKAKARRKNSQEVFLMKRYIASIAAIASFSATVIGTENPALAGRAEQTGNFGTATISCNATPEKDGVRIRFRLSAVRAMRTVALTVTSGNRRKTTSYKPGKSVLRGRMDLIGANPAKGTITTFGGKGVAADGAAFNILRFTCEV